MRVVAGRLGGRRLISPEGRTARPSSQLVRGAIFNSLQSRGLVAGARVVDLFAGSGALGIEAISRGAESVVFVESDRRVAATIRANLASLGETAVVRVMTVEGWMSDATRAEGGADLVIADPPYEWDGWDDLLGTITEMGATTVVAESNRAVVHPLWDVVVCRRHGGTVVNQLQRALDPGLPRQSRGTQ